ncbi:MAG: hypothetical protein Q9215_004930 [Flavoplaca cf. flavocitrina]
MPSQVQTCATLHNALLHNLSPPIASPRRDLPFLLQTQNPDLYTELQGTQLLEFLSLIDNYDAPDTKFTPHVRKPDPAAFLNYRDFDIAGEYPGHVLLYPDAESGNQGGLIYDTATDFCTWAVFPPWPRAEEWVPLEMVLGKWLELWEKGKFYVDDEEGLAVRSWVQSDVDEALEAWEGLMDAIAQRLPASTRADGDGGATQVTEPILGREQLERGGFHPFAVAFLERARRPPGEVKFVAPGIGIWSSISFAEAVENEPTSSSRRTYLTRARFEPEQIPSLLFPAIEPSKTDRHTRVVDPTEGEADDFDRDWGFGKFTLGRRAGVYLYPHPEVGGGDGVVVVEDSGRDDWGQRTERCAWGPGYPTRLVEMLGMWREMVESGSWGVGAEGVVGWWR